MDGPWCFTKNKNVRMELCDIPSCSMYSLSFFSYHCSESCVILNIPGYYKYNSFKEGYTFKCFNFQQLYFVS